MSDEAKKEPSREEYVVALSAEILKHGTVEQAERLLRQKVIASDDEIRDMVDEATMKLVSSAPPEIRGSMTTIIGYHRWNAIYKKAMSSGDTTNAIAAQKQLDRLMGSVH